MAIRFDDSGDYLSRTTNLLNYNSSYTVCFWLYISAGSQYYPHAWAICASSTEASGDYNNSDFLGLGSDGASFRVGAYALSSGSDALGSSLSLNTWYFVAVRRSSNTSLEALLNGVLDATCTQDITGRSAVAGEYMGRFNGTDYALNGRVSNYKSWDRALSDAEIRSEMLSWHPVSMDSFRHNYPMLAGSSERLYETTKGHSWTSNGTLTDEDGPSIAVLLTRSRRPSKVSSGGVGALSGTSDGVGTVSGALTGLGALSGAADGIGVVTGAMIALRLASGTSDGVATTSGSLTGLGALTGTSDGVATVTALLAGLGALAGTSTGQATVTGSILNEFISGLAEGIATVAGNLTGLGALSGVSNGLADVQAVLSAIASLSGTADGQATVTALLNGLAALSGTSDGLATVAAALVGIGALSGTSQGSATVTGVLLSEFMTGLAAGLATASGTLTATGALSGVSDGLASALGALTGIAAISGQVSALASTSGLLVGVGALSGIVEGSSTVQAALAALASISGSSSGLATVTGYLNYEGEILQRIQTIAFSSKPFGIAYFIPKSIGNVKINSF